MGFGSVPKWCLTLLAMFVVALVSIALLEAGLRGYESHVLNLPSIPSAKGAIHRQSSDPGRVYELVPDAMMEREGVEIRINSLGFRDDEPPPSPTGQRILVLGDSVAWGFGVRSDEAFPQLLEKALQVQARAAGEPEPVVYNSAVDGYSLAQEVATLEALGPSLQPDLVIVVYVLNDPSSAQDGGLDRYFRSELFLQRYGRIAIERLHEMSAGDALPADYFQRAHQLQATKVRREFERLSDLGDALHAQVMLAVCPVFTFEAEGRYDWSNIHNDLKLIAAEEKFNFLDLQPEFGAVASKDVSVDVLHPNALGHRIIAAALIKETSQLLASTKKSH